MNDNAIEKTDRLRLAIGEVVISFQFIENELAGLLANLLQMKEKEDKDRLCAAMGFKQKLDLVCDLYAQRKKAAWPDVDIAVARKSLISAEEFRNAIVHSFWYVSGMKRPVWMRSKSSLRSSAGLKVVDGVANTRAIEQGIEALKVVRDWYLGHTVKLNNATKQLHSCTKKLSRKVNIA